MAESATAEPPSKAGEPTQSREWLKKGALARELGISRPTLDKYLNRVDPPPPRDNGDAEWNVEQVAAYIASIQAEESAKKGPAYWETEKRRLECERIAHDIAVRKGKFISKEEAAQTIAPLMAELGQLLTQKFELELPPRYKGRDAVECAEMNRKANDEIAKRFRQGMKGITG